jgi:hypothetical protein
MMTSRALYSPFLLASLLLFIGCSDDGLVVNPEPPSASVHRIGIEGPDATTFEVGSEQSASWYAQNSTGEEVEVEVLSAPEGADYAITEAGGAYRKKITLNWNPGHDAEGSLHLLQLKAGSDSSEVTAAFDIYVALPVDATANSEAEREGEPLEF